MSVVAPIAGVVRGHPGDLRDRDRRPSVGRRRSPGSRPRSPASGSRRSSTRRGGGASRRASGSRCSQRVGFGFYFPWMHAAGKVDFWWASLVFRTTALLLVATAVAERRIDVRLSRRNVAIAVASASSTRSGTSASPRRREHGLVSLTAVLASLYPVVTVLLAASILHERVAPLQRAGIALTLAGVVARSASRLDDLRSEAGMCLDVEADVEHVPVRDDVRLALEPLLALRARPRRGSRARPGRASRRPRTG